MPFFRAEPSSTGRSVAEGAGVSSAGGTAGLESEVFSAASLEGGGMSLAVVGESLASSGTSEAGFEGEESTLGESGIRRARSRDEGTTRVRSRLGLPIDLRRPPSIGLRGGGMAVEEAEATTEESELARATE